MVEPLLNFDGLYYELEHLAERHLFDSVNEVGWIIEESTRVDSIPQGLTNAGGIHGDMYSCP